MKSLETVLKAISIEISQSKKVRCNECPYNGEYDGCDCDCTMHLLDDLLGHIEGLKQQNEMLTNSKRIYEETIEFLSDANKELLGDVKALKKENKKLIEQMYQMEQYIIKLRGS